MYIQKISLQNIRCFESLEMDFGDSKAGWHVILGTNGTGKSTLVRSVALGLIGVEEAQPLTFRYSWEYWLRISSSIGNIKLITDNGNSTNISFNKNNESVYLHESSVIAIGRENIFSVAYGSSRKITGGSKDYDNIWKNHPKLSAHLSCFGEDIALDKSIEWLGSIKLGLYIRQIPKGENINLALLEKIIEFINGSKLLPNGAKMLIPDFVIIFVDKNDVPIPIFELSDGYRSILSLVLELIRQLSRFHEKDKESFFVDNGEYLYIKTEGVVLIDEIDAHLHPTWQAKIGDWFTKHFPNIQFIVTTHSPIICRSAVNGTIWKLYNGETAAQITQITGVEKDQLLYGNILDAYETEIFGENISRSSESLAKLKRLAVLNVQKQVGRITEEEEKELKALQQIFQTDAQDNFLAD